MSFDFLWFVTENSSLLATIKEHINLNGAGNVIIFRNNSKGHSLSGLKFGVFMIMIRRLL